MQESQGRAQRPRPAVKELTVLCLIIFPCFGGDSIVWAPGPSGGGVVVVVVRPRRVQGSGRGRRPARPGTHHIRTVESKPEPNLIDDLGAGGTGSPRVSSLRWGPRGGATARRPRTETPGRRLDTPTHEHQHPSDGDPETQAHSRRRPDAFRQGHTQRGARTQRGPNARRHSSPEGPAPARPPGTRPRRTPLPSCR